MSQNNQTLATALLNLSLVYVVSHTGNLHSMKPADWAKVSKDPSLLEKMPVILHNPTCVHGKGLERLSSEERRPLYIEVKAKKGGKSTFKSTAITPIPASTKTAKGEKVAKVKLDGPQTVYVDDIANKKLYSATAEQFVEVQKDLKNLENVKSLKHNPTCVMHSLAAGGRISTEDARRPMYRIIDAKLVRIFSSPEAEKAMTVTSKPKASKAKVESVTA
jgi:hypothetical protein